MEGTVFTGVCLATLTGGGYPIAGQDRRGTPFPGQDGGGRYPIPGLGGSGGTPIPGLDGWGTTIPLSHVWMGVTVFTGVCLATLAGGGYPIAS